MPADIHPFQKSRLPALIQGEGVTALPPERQSTGDHPGREGLKFLTSLRSGVILPQQ